MPAKTSATGNSNYEYHVMQHSKDEECESNRKRNCRLGSLSWDGRWCHRWVWHHLDRPPRIQNANWSGWSNSATLDALSCVPASECKIRATPLQALRRSTYIPAFHPEAQTCLTSLRSASLRGSRRK